MHEAARPEQVPAARRAIALAAAGCAIGVACGGGSDAAPTAEVAPSEYVATAADFEGFQRWERLAIEGAAVPTKARPGPVAVYVNRRPPPGASAWPIGSVLVKAVETPGDPRDWTVHAMVKRGGMFNATGAVGWEFFGLQLTEEGRPVILWRSEGDNDGHSYSSALSLAGETGTEIGAELTCIDCHATAWQDDDVLTPALSLRAALAPEAPR